MIKDCRDTKASKTFSTAEKERNTRASRQHHAETHQANIAESATSNPITDYAFIAKAASLSIHPSPPQLKEERHHFVEPEATPNVREPSQITLTTPHSHAITPHSDPLTLTDAKIAPRPAPVESCHQQCSF
jgi:hypothetical protein